MRIYMYADDSSTKSQAGGGHLGRSGRARVSLALLAVGCLSLAGRKPGARGRGQRRGCESLSGVADFWLYNRGVEQSSFLNPGHVVRAARLHEGMRVADFGAGSGFFTRAAARLVGEAGLVWAVDVHQDMLPRNKNLALAEGLRNVEVVHGDVEKPKGSHLPAGNFDAVIVANLLFAAEHRAAIAREAARVLRPGGTVLIVDWKDSFGGLGPHAGHIITAVEAQKIFEAEGFANAQTVPAGSYHWGMLMRRSTIK